MPSYKHLPYAIFRRPVGGVGDAGRFLHMIMEGDATQMGLGVPAKSITLINHGPGILYYQISSNGQDVAVTDGIDSGQGKAYQPQESVYSAVVAVWSDNAATTYSLMATPGDWTDEELAEIIGG